MIAGALVDSQRHTARQQPLTPAPPHPCRQLSFNELVALYAITDVALVTSLRDGMNLGACGGRVWGARVVCVVW